MSPSYHFSSAEAQQLPLPPELEEAEGLVVLEVRALPRPLALVARPTLLVLLDKIHLCGLPLVDDGFKSSLVSESRGDRTYFFCVILCIVDYQEKLIDQIGYNS